MTATILENSGFNRDKKLKIVGASPVKHDGLDKVTGRARFGADLFLPGMLVGKILRCPHAHAIVKSIDTSAAERLAGVKAVVTRDDFPEIKAGTPGGDMTRNAMAREKALYDGHPVAAVCATSETVARQALKLIKVDYEVLPHVIDPVEAMKPGAPVLHQHVRTKGIKGADQPSNVIERLDLSMGDVEKGFTAAHVIVEREYDTKRCTRAISSRRAASRPRPRTARSSCGAAPRHHGSIATASRKSSRSTKPRFA
jgi:CO/xanthine dehydrogenase Mo-binding subunit